MEGIRSAARAPSTRSRAAVSSRRGWWLPVRGGHLWFEVAGRPDGLPAVTLHGGPGLDHSYMRLALAPLEARLRMFHLDLRGCGRSDGPKSFARFDWHTWVDDVEALRRHLGVDRWVVVGHSFGAPLALLHALEQPEHACGLVLWSPTLAPTVLGGRLPGLPVAALAALEAILSEPTQSDAAFRRRSLAAQPAYFASRLRPAQRAAFARMRLRAAPFDFAKRHVLPTLDLRARLCAVAAPALVVAGDQDFLLPPQEARALAERLPHGGLALLRRCGHFPGLERSRDFARALRGWLDEAGLAR